MDSILNSIKKLLNIGSEQTQFDTDIIIHINSVLAILNQMGIGEEGFRITSSTETWDQFLTKETDMESIRSYVYLKVRLLFDPPTSAALIESMNKLAEEFEWRAHVMAELPPVVEESDTSA